MSETEVTIDERIENALVVVKNRLAAMTDYADMQKAGQSILNLKMARAIHASIAKPTSEFDKELSFLLGKIRSNSGGNDMQQATQAALHIAQAKAYG